MGLKSRVLELARRAREVSTRIDFTRSGNTRHRFCNTTFYTSDKNRKKRSVIFLFVRSLKSRYLVAILHPASIKRHIWNAAAKLYKATAILNLVSAVKRIIDDDPRKYKYIPNLRPTDEAERRTTQKLKSGKLRCQFIFAE